MFRWASSRCQVPLITRTLYSVRPSRSTRFLLIRTKKKTDYNLSSPLFNNRRLFCSDLKVQWRRSEKVRSSRYTREFRGKTGASFAQMTHLPEWGLINCQPKIRLLYKSAVCVRREKTTALILVTCLLNVIVRGIRLFYSSLAPSTRRQPPGRKLP